MKLNLNCVRDTLITLEDRLVLDDNLEFNCLDLYEIRKSSNMLKYSRAEIAYTLIILNEAGFIKMIAGYDNDGLDQLDVVRLTYQGHQFLDTIRPKDTWDKIYAIAEKTGHKSITNIMDIANILLPETFKSALRS